MASASSAMLAIEPNKNPVRSGSGERRLAVRAVVDRWFAPTQRWFKVDAYDGDMYVLRHDETSGEWEIAAYRVRGSLTLPELATANDLSFMSCITLVSCIEGRLRCRRQSSMDSAELARISATFVKAIAEAQTLADSGQFDAELQELLRHGRELLALALEELDSGGPGSGEYVRGLVISTGLKLEQLEALLDTSARH